jgi:peptidoglycan/LPS O-acetylase OafA/YrhL
MANLKFLDRAKGVAVFGVLAVHVSQVPGLFSVSAENITGRLLGTFVNNGARGVQLFFIVSGYSLALNFYKYQSGSYGILRFYVSRFFRIYPVWIFTLICYLLLSAGGEKFFLSATFLFGFLRWQEPNPEIVIGGWSLFCEILYYAAFPILFYFMRVSIRHTIIMLMLGLIARVSWLEIAPIFGISDNNSFVGLFPLSNLYAFILGIAIFMLKPIIQKGSLYSRKIAYCSLALLVIALVLPGIDQVFISILMAINIAYEQNREPQYGKRSLMETIEKRCYPIYLLQFLLIYQFEEMVDFSSSRTNLLFFPVLFFLLGLSLLLSSLVFMLIEKPMVKIGRRINDSLELK